MFRGYILFQKNNFKVSGMQSVPSSTLPGCFSSAQSQFGARRASIFVNKQIRIYIYIYIYIYMYIHTLT